MFVNVFRVNKEAEKAIWGRVEFQRGIIHLKMIIPAHTYTRIQLPMCVIGWIIHTNRLTLSRQVPLYHISVWQRFTDYICNCNVCHNSVSHVQIHKQTRNRNRNRDSRQTVKANAPENILMRLVFLALITFSRSFTVKVQKFSINIFK